MTTPGVKRYDEEGNDKTWEDDHVTQYWLKHYVKDGNCALCDQSGKIKTEHHGTHFCICPNGQVGRWVAAGKEIKPLWMTKELKKYLKETFIKEPK